MKRSTAYALLFLGVALLPFLLESSHAAGQLHVTVYTDKGTYDPGELVSIQGQVSDGGSTPVPFASVSIQANDPDGKPVHIALLVSSVDGSYSDQFTTPSNSINGGYTIYVTASKPGYADAYSQAACIITPELTPSHTPWLVFFLAVFALLLTKGKRHSSKIALERTTISTGNVATRPAHSVRRNGMSPQELG